MEYLGVFNLLIEHIHATSGKGGFYTHIELVETLVRFIENESVKMNFNPHFKKVLLLSVHFVPKIFTRRSVFLLLIIDQLKIKRIARKIFEYGAAFCTYFSLYHNVKILLHICRSKKEFKLHVSQQLNILELKCSKYNFVEYYFLF